MNAQEHIEAAELALELANGLSSTPDLSREQVSRAMAHIELARLRADPKFAPLIKPSDQEQALADIVHLVNLTLDDKSIGPPVNQDWPGFMRAIKEVRAILRLRGIMP